MRRARQRSALRRFSPLRLWRAPVARQPARPKDGRQPQHRRADAKASKENGRTLLGIAAGGRIAFVAMNERPSRVLNGGAEEMNVNVGSVKR